MNAREFPRAARRWARRAAGIGYLFVFVLGAASLICLGQAKAPGWEAKDWTLWTEEDCEKVLHASPWGYRYDRSSGYADRNPIWGPSSTVSQYWHEEQLRSALPIRQALIRQEQLQKNYKKMNAQKRQAFDEQMAARMATYAGDRIVVYVSDGGYTSSSFPGDLTSDYSFPGEPSASLLNLSRKKSVSAVEIRNFKKDYKHVEFEAFFPRVVDGEPLFGPGDTRIVFRFGYVADSKSEYLGGGAFDLSKLMFKGKLEY